MANSFEHRKWK